MSFTMSTTLFECKTHIVPCSHIRHYARSTSQCQEDELYLHVRQYIPRNATPTKGDVTIIAAHATGFQKELYEPLWDELLLYTQRTGAFQIRAIWIADMFNQGVSGLLNKSKLGNERTPFHSCPSLLPRVVSRAGLTEHTSVLVRFCSRLPRLGQPLPP